MKYTLFIDDFTRSLRQAAHRSRLSQRFDARRPTVSSGGPRLLSNGRGTAASPRSCATTNVRGAVHMRARVCRCRRDPYSVDEGHASNISLRVFGTPRLSHQSHPVLIFARHGAPPFLHELENRGRSSNRPRSGRSPPSIRRSGCLAHSRPFSDQPLRMELPRLGRSALQLVARERTGDDPRHRRPVETSARTGASKVASVNLTSTTLPPVNGDHFGTDSLRLRPPAGEPRRS